MDNLSHLRSEGDINLSPRRAAFQSTHLDDATRALLAADAEVFLHQSLSTPCLNALQGCEGPYLEDLQGRRILDFHGNSVHQVGFGHPKVKAAIAAQMEALPFCTRRYTNAVAVELAQRLCALVPGGPHKALFAPGGTAAIGMALKLARYATGRFKTISLWESFHGASLDAISLGGEAIFRQGVGPLLPGCEHAPPPEPIGCPFRCGDTCNAACADYIEYMLEREGDVAAVVAETVRCTPFIPPRDYWQRVRAACDKHGALLILDEIPIGLGRTGRMFAVEHYGIAPDILVLGKGLGGGIMPLAALISRAELDVAPERALGHYTHEKNPVACAAALATLDILEHDGALENAQHLGTRAHAALETLRRRYPLVREVRGLGLLLGLVLTRADGSKAVDEAEAVMYAALRRGLSFKTTMGNILTLTPPLTLTEAQLDDAIAMLDASLAEVTAGC